MQPERLTGQKAKMRQQPTTSATAKSSSTTDKYCHIHSNGTPTHLYTLCVLHSQHGRVSIRFHHSDMTHRTMIIFLGRYLIHSLWKNGYRSEHRAHEANALLHKYLMVTQPGAARKKIWTGVQDTQINNTQKLAFAMNKAHQLVVKCTKILLLL